LLEVGTKAGAESSVTTLLKSTTKEKPMQVIPTRVHGILDYVVGVLLIAAPWLFQFNHGGAETWVPVALGAATILYSLCTDYERGVLRLVPMEVHLGLDLMSAVLLAVSPWLFGFRDLVWAPHVVIALVEICTVLLSRHQPRDVYRVQHEGEAQRRPSGAHG
jgi:hypothetical protein